MVVPVSDNSSEYTLISPVLAAPSSTPLYYVVDGDNRVIRGNNGTAFILRQNSAWEPLSAAAGTPHTTEVVSSIITEGTKTYTTEITCSNRTLQPYRWRSKCVDGTSVIYDNYWLRYGGGDPAYSQTGVGPPVGGATDLNERWWERYLAGGNDPATMPFHHNPTMGGAGDRPTVGSDMAASAKMYTGNPYHYFVRSRIDANTPALIEGGNAPLDFGGDPGNYEYSDHGNGSGVTAEDRLTWWWRMRMWRRFLPNYNSMPRVTRVDNASYTPFDWDNDGVSYGGSPTNRVVLYFVENWDLIPSGLGSSGFDKCYLLNVSSQTSKELSNVFPVGNIIDNANGFESVQNVSRHRSTWQYSQTTGVFGQAAQGLAVVPGYSSTFQNTPYLALAFVNSQTKFCFAVGTKLEKCTDTDEELRPDLANACSLQARNRILFSSTPFIEYSNEGPIAYVIHKSRTKRGIGWISHRTFVYTGEFSSLPADMYSLYEDGEFDATISDSDIPVGVAESLIPESFNLRETFDRGQLHPFVALIHYINEQAKILNASAYYDVNLSAYSTENNWKNVLLSYANSSTEYSGAFPEYFNEYVKTKFGREFHKLYYDYCHNFNRHKAINQVINLDGPTIFGHAFGSILYNSKLNNNGSLTNQYPQLITSSLNNLITFNAGDGVFSSGAQSSGTYVASTISDCYVKTFEYRNSGILDHIEFCQTSGASPNNSFSVIRLDKSNKQGARYNPVFHENTVIRQKSLSLFDRMIFDISKYNVDQNLGYSVTNNFLSPNHKFKLQFKTLIVDQNGRTTGGDSVGVWIHTKPENGKIWTFTKDKVWVQHSASGLEIADVVQTYAHNFGFNEVSRNLDPGKLRCGKFLNALNQNRFNDVMASLEAEEFSTISLEFDTDNLPLSVPNDYYTGVAQQVHRANQRYVIEVFSNCKNSTKFTLFYNFDLMDMTLNKWSKLLITGQPNGSVMGDIYCKEYRVDLSREQVLTAFRYFNDITGLYSNFGYASRVGSYTSGVYEASGGSRINYVENPLWNTHTLNTSSLIESLSIIN